MPSRSKLGQWEVMTSTGKDKSLGFKELRVMTLEGWVLGRDT